jgi:hypothetical protein
MRNSARAASTCDSRDVRRTVAVAIFCSISGVVPDSRRARKIAEVSR